MMPELVSSAELRAKLVHSSLTGKRAPNKEVQGLENWALKARYSYFHHDLRPGTHYSVRKCLSASRVAVSPRRSALSRPVVSFIESQLKNQVSQFDVSTTHFSIDEKETKITKNRRISPSPEKERISKALIMSSIDLPIVFPKSHHNTAREI